jgi:hypothetical protein
MHSCKLVYAVLLVAGATVCSLPACAVVPPAPAPIISQSQITPSGAGFTGETYKLPKVIGDWFQTPTDAHVSLRQETSVDAAQRVILDIEWDGLATTHTITNESNHDGTATHRSGFYLTYAPKGRSSTSVAPSGSEAIVVTVQHLDDNQVEATINGTITINNGMTAGGGSVQVTGTISLKRTGAHNEKVGGTFGDCDPVIHDKLVGAEFRSPSACEVKFDQHVRDGLIAAVTPLINSFTAGGWMVDKAPFAGPITSIPRHTESAPFRVKIELELRMSPDNEVYQRLNKASQEAMEKASAQMALALKGGTVDPHMMDAATKSVRELADNTLLGITIDTNAPSAGAVAFQGGHTVNELPGGGTVVFLPAAQAPTGGGADAAVSLTWVLLGSWSAPAPVKPGTGEENLSVKGGLLPGKPVLAVQNVYVRIHASRELAERAIQQIDWGKLRGVL